VRIVGFDGVNPLTAPWCLKGCNCELCANILPAVCPNWSGFWARFAACSGAVR
jgi:hypothetical protein